MVRLEPAQFEALDDWIKKHDVESRPEAIRRLVEIGLSAKSRPKQHSRARADKANAMAADQLDQLADDSATTQEQATRKHRLLKGPEEFQNVRVDRTAKD